MKKILYITHTNIEKDGRTKLLVEIVNKLGVLYILSSEIDEDQEHTFAMEGSFAIKKAIAIVKKHKIDILFIDNRMSCVEGLILKRLFPRLCVIQDARELYLLNRRSSLKSNFGTLLERMLMRQSDIVICANKFRADYMLENFKLKKRPLVYENIRKLASNEKNTSDYEKKYSWLSEKELPIIISSSGCTIERTNDKLVLDFKRLDDKAVLVFVGGEPEADLLYINKLINENMIKNVYRLGRINPEELQYLVSISAIGIVNYGQYDLNNIYCASGKLFEYIYERIPVVTTTNPPLKHICETFNIGEANEDYADAILKVLNDYQYYKKNIEIFLSKNWIEENNNEFVENLKAELNRMKR